MVKYFYEEVSNNIGRGNVVMKKLLGILVLGLIICSSVYASIIAIDKKTRVSVQDI